MSNDLKPPVEQHEAAPAAFIAKSDLNKIRSDRTFHVSVIGVREGRFNTPLYDRPQPAPIEGTPTERRAVLTAEDVERQYRDGVHIGSGLPRAICPCGFCMKHRHGFNRGDEAICPEPRTEGEAVYRIGNDGVCRIQAAPLEGTGNGAVPALTDQQWEELRLIARTYNERGFPKHAREFFARVPRTEVAGAVPEGWKLMPVDPTVEMLTFVYDPGADDSPSERYAALLAAAPQPSSADAAAEDKYVIERLSTVLAGVAVALLGEEADRPAAETLQKLPDEAAKLRLELDLYRAQAADAAAAPADERAALVERVLGMFEAWPKDELGPTDEPESQYRFGYNTALEDVLTALDVPPARGSRAAASQPAAAAGQEAVVIPAGWQLVPIEPTAEILQEIWRNERDSPRAWRDALRAAPQPPAQVATRQGLTEALRQAREELSNVEWENDPPARVTDLFSKIDALLEGAKR